MGNLDGFEIMCWSLIIMFILSGLECFLMSGRWEIEDEEHIKWRRKFLEDIYKSLDGSLEDIENKIKLCNFISSSELISEISGVKEYRWLIDKNLLCENENIEIRVKFKENNMISKDISKEVWNES